MKSLIVQLLEIQSFIQHLGSSYTSLQIYDETQWKNWSWQLKNFKYLVEQKNVTTTTTPCLFHDCTDQDDVALKFCISETVWLQVFFFLRQSLDITGWTLVVSDKLQLTVYPKNINTAEEFRFRMTYDDHETQLEIHDDEASSLLLLLNRPAYVTLSPRQLQQREYGMWVPTTAELEPVVSCESPCLLLPHRFSDSRQQEM
jgi:hypothetical protein